MQIQGSTALVTGANRGLGAAFVEELLARGAVKVYAAARTPEPSDDPRVAPLALDVTDAAQVEAAAARAGDVTLVINNAGSHSGARIADGDFAAIQADLDTNFFGPIAVTRAFAPILAAHGGGAVVTVHSVLSWISAGDGYSASKAAAWSATNALRSALAPAGTTVTGVHVGYIDTDMAASIDAPKIAPREVAAQALDGVEAGADEVLADEVTRGVKAGLAGDPMAFPVG
ncbi:SDR family oxidoreductase [Aquihabitans sp. McL0605]|uniref:SDR family oxidoreductase n=1 Tax=Aquihabitans sp. McL0605 TaxID=3415671 RepID=UPI003CF25366